MRAGPREQVLTRLATTQGHLDGIRRMVGHGDPALEIIRQIRAVRSALLQIDELLVREGLYSCLVLATEGRPERALSVASWLLGLKTNPGLVDLEER